MVGARIQSALGMWRIFSGVRRDADLKNKILSINAKVRSQEF